MMKKEPKTGKEKNYKATEDQNNILSEPEAVYYSNNPTTRTIGMMGLAGKKEFDTIRSENDFINIIRTGVPKQAMTHLMDIAELSLLEMAAIIHTSDRTLRRYKPQQKLSEEQSERMIQIAKLYSKGEDVFGSINEFRLWMDTQLEPLGNRKPKEYLDTSIGINMLMDELGRMEHGIFA